MIAPRSKETSFENNQNFKGTPLKRDKNLEGYGGGGELLDHPVCTCHLLVVMSIREFPVHILVLAFQT